MINVYTINILFYFSFFFVNWEEDTLSQVGVWQYVRHRYKENQEWNRLLELKVMVPFECKKAASKIGARRDTHSSVSGGCAPLQCGSSFDSPLLLCSCSFWCVVSCADLLWKWMEALQLEGTRRREIDRLCMPRAKNYDPTPSHFASPKEMRSPNFHGNLALCYCRESQEELYLLLVDQSHSSIRLPCSHNWMDLMLGKPQLLRPSLFLSLTVTQTHFLVASLPYFLSQCLGRKA